MSEQAFHLSPGYPKQLLTRYRKQAFPTISYGTVAAFCDSCDHVPFLPHIQGDLKDLQRPEAFKMLLGLCPVGSRLMEVGAGEPYVAQMLVEIGYRVTVVDPYDGSGRGPTEYEYYKQKYPDVRLIRNVLSDSINLDEHHCFDGIYSISVLEHVHQPHLGHLFDGIQKYLRPGGFSLHLIDHVLQGAGSEFHLHQLSDIVSLQAKLAQTSAAESVAAFHAAIAKAATDVETFFLSPAGHNLWRGQTSYQDFPFRKVMSVHSLMQRAR